MENPLWNLVRLQLINNPDPRDLTLNNLQDVMEEDLYGSSGFSSSSHLLSKPSYYHSYNMNFHQRLSMNNNPNFVLSSYDDDYNHTCILFPSF